MTVGVDLPWTKMINPQLVDLKAGLIALKQRPGELHLNHNGDMHAGVIFSMAEMTGMGVVVMQLGSKAEAAFVAVKSVNIEFLKRAQGDITFKSTLTDEQQMSMLKKLEAQESIEEVVHVEALDGESRKVASAQVVAVIKPKG